MLFLSCITDAAFFMFVTFYVLIRIFKKKVKKFLIYQILFTFAIQPIHKVKISCYQSNIWVCV